MHVAQLRRVDVEDRHVSPDPDRDLARSKLCDTTLTSLARRPAGNERMQEISSAVQEGPRAYLNRQYTTIGIAGVVLFLIIGFALNWPTAIGFLFAFTAARCRLPPTTTPCAPRSAPCWVPPAASADAPRRSSAARSRPGGTPLRSRGPTSPADCSGPRSARSSWRGASRRAASAEPTAWESGTPRRGSARAPTRGSRCGPPCSRPTSQSACRRR